jgi:hypothetical protein
MAFSVFHNPRNVTINATPITGVTAVTVRLDSDEIHASADDDLHESVARYATARTGGAIELVDPVQASEAAYSVGTLSFDWTDVKGQSDRTVTIAGCSLGPWRSTVRRDAASQAEIPFIAESAPVLS